MMIVNIETDTYSLVGAGQSHAGTHFEEMSKTCVIHQTDELRKRSLLKGTDMLI